MSPKFTARGQQAANRQQFKNKLRVKAGQGRISRALGASDPRHHRNPQAAQDTARQFSADFFTVDKEGRLRPKE